MTEKRDDDHTEITRTYGLAYTLIWGIILLVSVQFVAGIVELGSLVHGIMETQPGSLIDTASNKILYLLLLIFLIRWLSQLNRIYCKQIIEIHQQKTQLLNPAVLAEEMEESLLHDTNYGE